MECVQGFAFRPHRGIAVKKVSKRNCGDYVFLNFPPFLLAAQSVNPVLSCHVFYTQLCVLQRGCPPSCCLSGRLVYHVSLVCAYYISRVHFSDKQLCNFAVRSGEPPCLCLFSLCYFSAVWLFANCVSLRIDILESSFFFYSTRDANRIHFRKGTRWGIMQLQHFPIEADWK